MPHTPPSGRSIAAIKARLLKLGGRGFQFDWVLEQELSEELIASLLRHGEAFPGSIARLVPGRVSSCHDNAAAFVRANPAWFNYFGFALSGGVWRVHSWAIYTDGPRITRGAETTVLRERYFGVPVGGGRGVPSLAASAAAGHPPAMDRS